jgi:protein-disulfide isomerase
VSKGARIREQRKVQAPKRKGKQRDRVPKPPAEGVRQVSSRILYAGAAGAAALIATVLVAASVISSGGSSKPPAGDIPITSADTTKLLRGIPQNGIALGKPNAPVTLYEFADVQCPFCAEFSGNAFPDIVRDYVRPGKVRIEFRGVDFLGPDSNRGLKFALAAGEQGKLWNVIHLLYANQGEEGSGWVNDDLLASIGRAVPGLDVQKAFANLDSQAVSNQLQSLANSSAEYGINSTPSFAAGPTGGKIERFGITSLDANALRPTLDKLLKR